MRDTYLAYSPPWIGQAEIDEVTDTLHSDWITTGPKARKFEAAFAQRVGAPAALAVSSGTDAMLVALAALGIGPGAEVITTAMTFCSTVHVIEHLGARPVLVDVEPDTLNLDPRRVAEAITPRTRAIMPVHLYGHPAEMDALQRLARQHRLDLVEDAAHAFPAQYRGRMIGSIGTATAFSFYATKNITTAEGGMLTGSQGLIDRARLWSLHGMSKDAFNRYSASGSWYYEVVLPGFKCNMTDIQAALGLCQLKRVSQFQQRRRELWQQYQEALAPFSELELPVERAEVESALHIYPIRLRLDELSLDRAQFIQELKARNIGASVHFIPVHLHPYYRDRYGYAPTDFPVAFENYQRLVSLPLNPRMTDADLESVVEAVSDTLATARRAATVAVTDHSYVQARF
jgi:dTDP-4-amino-4,6-dideoxygalactose transaminase